MLLTVASARADEVDLSSVKDIQELSLEDLLNPSVQVATKSEMHAADVPAVVTVIGADEIQARGYSSLADVLRTVPGFYDVYDGVDHNVGVRGINGGAHAAGSVIKLMIDGVPVDFRPTTGNFFGEELIPIDMIQRVEIIRGPASALYGANAFLGVVNVVTKSGEQIDGVHLVGQGALVRTHPGGGGAAIAGGSGTNVSVIVGASYLYLDRSGLGLPGSSPVLQNDTNGIGARAPSRNDIAQPKSMFGKLELNGAWGHLRLLASIQNLESGGEFQDFATLTHHTRVATLNQHYAADYHLSLGQRVSLHLSGYYFNGSPASSERLDIGRPDYILVRNVGADGYSLAAEAQIKPHRLVDGLVGVDFLQENHDLQSFSRKLLVDQGGQLAGTIIPDPNGGKTRTFYNVGAFIQGTVSYKSFSGVLGARLDWQNIYGVNFSPRAGLVYTPRKLPLSLKLLYGSSYKAPSAVQLFTQPMAVGGTLGYPQLQAQTAHTIELSAGYRLPRERGALTLNFFATDVIGLVEFVSEALYLQARNTQDVWVMGGELDSNFKVAKPISLRFSASVAKTVSQTGSSAFQSSVEEPSYPVYQFHLIGDYFLPWWGLRLSAEASYIGPRGASQSNSLIANGQYQLGGYVYTAAALSTAGRRIIPGQTTSIALRVSNVINYIWAEPGYNGIDVPAQGITAMLTVVQSL